MYLLVEFTEEGTTSPLPKDWVINDLAWWPSYKDQSTFLRSIKNREIPKPDKGWTQHQVRVLYESDKLDNVTRKWKASCNTSDLNSDEETRKKSRSRKRPCWWSDEDDEDSSITKRPKNKFPQPPKPPNVPTPIPKPHLTVKGKPVASSYTSPSIHRVRQQPKEAYIRTLPSFQTPVPTVNQQQRKNNPRALSTVQTQYTPSERMTPLSGQISVDTFQMSSPPIDGEQGDLRTLSSCRLSEPGYDSIPSDCTSPRHATERCILEAIGEVQLQLQHLTAVVQSMAGDRCRGLLQQTQLEEDSEENLLPLQSAQDFEELENGLSNTATRKKTVSKLSLGGGQTMKKTIWRICEKVFTPHLAVSLNWCGRGDKRGIGLTRIKDVIVLSAMRNPQLSHPNEAEAEKAIKDWLRLAPDRVNRRRPRAHHALTPSCPQT
ncbi:uncharacterized protein [Hoplias malabaricus]|uniref:uncharacterized protein isoform X2 n=1 Tax=Hoplias malabaricus TaxID=27720 RepID=UPI003463195E